jgi:outer membrane lipoprotein carrier protein
MQDTNSEYLLQVARYRFQVKNLRPAIRLLCGLLLLGCCIGCLATAYGADVATVVAGLKRRYASVDTIAGNFQQTYRAPGIDQVESGVFWLKRPGLMRWEYLSPEEKLFVADGRESFLYVPQDHQVTVQPLTATDLHGTPLQFLLGETDIDKSFVVSWEADFKPQGSNTYVIRLTPRKREADYAFLVLELDQTSYGILRIIIRELSGNTSEFLLTNVSANVKIENKKFRFKAPKGVEVIRLTSE